MENAVAVRNTPDSTGQTKVELDDGSRFREAKPHARRGRSKRKDLPAKPREAKPDAKPQEAKGHEANRQIRFP